MMDVNINNCKRDITFLQCSLLLLHCIMHCMENTTELVHIASK